MSLKNKSKEYYKEKFDELFDSGLPIIDYVTEEEFEASDGEIFEQCYADTPERRTFPKFWFVSNYGNLISVGEKRLVWVHKIPRNDNKRFSYKYMIKDNEDKRVVKNIELHNLVGLVFGSESFGRATELIKEKGVQAFGVNNLEELKAQGHHIDGECGNNEPENIKFVTDKVHTLFDSIPDIDSKEEDEFKFMKKFGKLMSEENPNAITILLPGQTFKNGKWHSDKSVDIFSTKQITLSANAYRELMSLIKEVI